MKIPKNEFINLLIRIMVGSVFIITGIGKIVDPALFARDISNYDMLPYKIINLFAITLPWVELICGILFLLGVRLQANIILLASMLIVFNVAIGVAWARGLNINCGCFSDITTQKVGIENSLKTLQCLQDWHLCSFFQIIKYH